jgi:hypothetical protein
MSESRFTPGPWRAEGPDDFRDFNILHDGDSLAVAAAVSNMRSLDEIEANARLIAAAPDLIEALEDLKRELVLSDVDLDYIESHFRPWLNKAESAAAKARGYLFSPMPIFATASPMGKE